MGVGQPRLSEIQLETELNVPGIAGTCNNPESCVGLDIARRKTPRRRRWVRCKGGRCARVSVLRVIQNIKKLCAELKIGAFREAKVLENRHVPIVNAGTAHKSATG